VQIIGWCAENQALRELITSVRAGMSSALVLRGEPGIGKFVLLDYAVGCAAHLRVVRSVAVEAERSLGFAVHQLLMPLLGGVDRLPEPQRRALGVAFGLLTGRPAGPFLVGLAVRAAEPAGTRPGTRAAHRYRRRPSRCPRPPATWQTLGNFQMSAGTARCAPRCRGDRQWTADRALRSALSTTVTAGCR